LDAWNISATAVILQRSVLKREVSLEGIVLDIQSDKAGTSGNSSLHKHKHISRMQVIASQMPQLPLLFSTCLLQNQNLMPHYLKTSTTFLLVQTSCHIQVNMEQMGQPFSEQTTVGSARLLRNR